MDKSSSEVGISPWLVWTRLVFFSSVPAETGNFRAAYALSHALDPTLFAPEMGAIPGIDGRPYWQYSASPVPENMSP